MIINCDNPIIDIHSVERISWRAERYEVAAREYSALAFRIKGSAVISDGRREYTVNANEVLYLPQGMAYTADYTDTELLVIHFKTLTDDSEAEVYKLNNYEEVHRHFLKAHSLWQKREPAYAVYTVSILYKVLALILESYAKERLPEHFLKAVAYINSNYKNSALTVGEACRAAGIGETVFRKLFKTHYQKTPVDYITELRLEFARNLISSGETVELSATESGFSDPKYFSRVVKKNFGCTPRQLRLFGK